MSDKQYLVRVISRPGETVLTVWHDKQIDFDNVPEGCYVMTDTEYRAFEALGVALLGDVPIRFVEGPLNER